MVKHVDVNLGIKIGTKFIDLEKFQVELQAKCASNFVQFYINGSRTVDAATQKVKRYLDPQLKYYSVHWACVHGGRQYKSRGKGLRRTMTLRKEQLCPAHVHIIIDRSGREFVVSSVCSKHNHLVSKQLFQLLPHNRKLNRNAKRLLQSKINKQMLRTDLENELDKCITFKDVRYLQHLGKEGNDDLQTVCDIIQSKFDTPCHLLIDEDNVFKGLTFFTNEMKGSMAAFPELICIDTTYKLMDIEAALYVILNENGNGESSVVGVGILILEDEDSMEWFLDTFKSCNPSWDEIQIIISDKDITERDVLKKVFPSAELQSCIFHVFKIFQSEITCEKFKITPNARPAILESLLKLVYSKNEFEFNAILTTIQRNCPDGIYRYLNEHWVAIKEEWCPFLGDKVHNFMNPTNKALEGINAKLKEVCIKHGTLEQFVDHLFIALNSLEKERNARIACFLNKRKTHFYSIEDFRSSYSEVLTPYAFNKLETQFSFYDVEFSSEENCQFYKVKSDSSEYFTTSESCTCYFHKSMGMPCRHIFAVRHFLEINLFQSNLIIERWKMSYFLENSVFLNAPEDIPENAPSVYIDNLSNMTREERYRQTFVKAKFIATLAADVTGNNYTYINDLLDKFITNLQNSNYNFDIVSKNVDEENDAVLEEMHNSSDSNYYNNGTNIEISGPSGLNSQPVNPIDFVATDESHNITNNKNIRREHLYSVDEHLNIVVASVDNNSNSDQNENPVDPLDLENIEVPSVKRPGQPVGSAITVIGLPKKKQKKTGLLPYAQMPVRDRIDIILKWILKDTNAVTVKEIDLRDLLPADQVDVRLLEVNLTLLKKFFSKGAWESFLMYKCYIRKHAKWLCVLCKKEIIRKDATIRCDFCLRWIHFACSKQTGKMPEVFTCVICELMPNDRF